MEKADIRCGVAEIKVSSSSDVYAPNVFNTVDKGNVMVDCSWDQFEVGPESIVYMDNKDLHTMMVIPIQNESRDFLAETDNIADDNEYVTCGANIKSYTWYGCMVSVLTKNVLFSGIIEE